MYKKNKKHILTKKKKCSLLTKRSMTNEKLNFGYICTNHRL